MRYSGGQSESWFVCLTFCLFLPFGREGNALVLICWCSYVWWGVWLFTNGVVGLCLYTRAVGGAVGEGLLLLLSVLFLSIYKALRTITSSAMFIHRARVPVLVRQRSGILFVLHLGTGRDHDLSRMILGFNGSIGVTSVRSIGLCCDNARTERGCNGGFFAPMSCVSDRAPKGALTTGPSCSVGGSRMGGPKQGIVLGTGRGLFPKVGCF